MISIDPGRDCYWAKWSDNEWECRAPNVPLINHARLDSCGPWPCHDLSVKEKAVIETQVIIPKFTRNPADIIVLAQLAGAVAAHFGGVDAVQWVKPHTWKGNTKKPRRVLCAQCKTLATPKPRCRDCHTPWASYAIHRAVVAALDPMELAIFTVQLERLAPGERHNLADAVGIGLWALNRMATPRTESPARTHRMDALAETLRRQGQS